VLRSVRFWLGIAISVLLIVLFFRTTHIEELRGALREANYWYLVPAAAIFFAAVGVRCMRWSLLMRPVKPISPARLYPYAIIGYMANNLLPARAGEVVRAYVTGDRENCSRTAVFGTIAVERLFDGCVLVAMLLIAGSIVGFENGKIQVIAIASSAFFLAALIGFYVLTLSEERAKRVTRFFLRALPERLEHMAEHITDMLVGSLRSVHNPRALAAVVSLSAMAWTVEAASFAVVGKGFGLDVGFGDYVLLLAASNLAIIIPTFLGGTGPFEWATRLVLVSAGVAEGLAGAYALVAHALVVVPTTILGLILLWTFGIAFGRLTRLGQMEEEVGLAP
jgi:uncharacterized protein (TIRG00374 family)